MSFDFKKEYKDLYAPKAPPPIVNVRAANFIAISGRGRPKHPRRPLSAGHKRAV